MWCDGEHSNLKHDHLLIHSDAEGYYLPQDFESVIFTPESLEMPGEMVGSSQHLLAETRSIAQALELDLSMDPESDELREATEEQGEGEAKWQRYGVESFCCIRLHRAAQHSIRHGAAIVFT